MKSDIDELKQLILERGEIDNLLIKTGETSYDVVYAYVLRNYCDDEHEYYLSTARPVNHDISEVVAWAILE